MIGEGVSIVWNLTSHSGIIVRDDPVLWWNTGRVTAVLALPNRRLLAVGSHAGVWVVESDGTAISMGVAVEAPEADRLDQLGVELKRAIAEFARRSPLGDTPQGE